MRIVMVSKALVVGAYQNKLEELARLPGIELAAIVPSSWRDASGTSRLERGHTRGYRLEIAPLAFNGQYHLHFYPTLGRILRRLRPDVLHMDEEPYNLATWAGLINGQSVGARGLFFSWQNLLRRYPWPFRFFESANYRRGQHAIAGSHTAAGVLRTKGFLGPISVIPQFGVDPARFSPAPKADRTRASDYLSIGYAGRFVPEKGLDVLVNACATLPADGWTLSLLGQGPEQANLEALAEQLGVGSRVRFSPPRPSTDMPSFFRTLDVFVLPSLSRPNWIEQFGRVLIEAMACGTAVVGSDCGEIPQVIGDAGLLVPEGDSEALARALLELQRNRERLAVLGQLGRERVLRQFSQAQIAKATREVYVQMLSTPGSHDLGEQSRPA